MMKRIVDLGIAVVVLLAWVAGTARADDARETPAVKAVRRVLPSVVNLNSEKTSYSGDTQFSTGRGRKVNGMGTGIVVDERGYIITNHHVVDGVDTLTATLHDGSTYDAQIVATDRAQDLAIIRIRAGRPLAVMPVGTSSDLMLAEDVLAIGNAFGYNGTVTRGNISALGRDVEVNEKQGYRNLIQTDASINPGNSGGPLVNMEGEVIGVNVAIRAGAQRIGFAIPIDDARKVVARLMSVEQLDRNWHGIVGRDQKNGKSRQLVIDGILPDSPAAAAGLQAKDVIVHSGNVDVTDAVDLERSLLGRSAGDKIEVTVKRDGKTEKMTLGLSKRVSSTAEPPQDVIVRANNDNGDDLASRTWKILGIKLQPIAQSERALVGSRYRGGMRVTEVRTGGPADTNGIQRGDILVGLALWETINTDNVSYILDHPELTTKYAPLKFYILRGRETLYGHLQVAAKAN